MNSLSSNGLKGATSRRQTLQLNTIRCSQQALKWYRDLVKLNDFSLSRVENEKVYDWGFAVKFSIV